jgi:Glycosyl transferase family 64 domain
MYDLYSNFEPFQFDFFFPVQETSFRCITTKITIRAKNDLSVLQVAFIQHPTDSLNNRFKPIEGPHDKAIFAADDDIRVPCNELDLAYETWLSSELSIVGFMPRIHLRRRPKDDKLVYRCWWNVWWHGAYSIVLTKAAFINHDYFNMYTNEMPSTIRELVDKERNCEDLAMQFLVSAHSNLPPIFVKGHLQDLGVLNGISTSKNVVSAGHMDKRSQCLNDLVDIYERNPLIRSHMIVDSASNGWTNAPSTWMEYISSDLWKFT